MKKALFAVLAACPLLFAESYQVNTLSAKQLGMGHTGAGQKLGSESMHYNPGGLGFLDKTLDISAGITFIMPEVEFEGKEVNNKMGTPIYVYAGSSISNWFSAGLSFTTPYGNSMDLGESWAGANLLQDISLSVYALQPTVAFKFLDKISIGGGPTINLGSFSLSKRLIPTGYLSQTALPALATGLRLMGETVNAEFVNSVIDENRESPISAEFSGDADVGLGFHLGALYDVLPNKLAFGISYRSEVEMKLAKGKAKGTENMTKLNAILVGLGQSPLPVPPLDQGTFEAELPLPANLNAGLSVRPIEKLLLAFDLQMIFWGAYEELSLDFTKDGQTFYKSVSEKNYHNTLAYRFGVQYTLIDQLDLRLGMYYDETPVDDEYLTPESPSTNKLGSTIGFSFRPIPNLSIDASFLYALGFGRDAKSGSKKDSNGSVDGLDGRYEVQAWAPSVGVSFNF
ncbi:MAG: outer membrane protein transport protein [Candidatus Fibromonas sp.]|jgi:long-chain fatty acid transport protein|nr:outer membrane protein transport protein [Candidatus Fibromonas sp.]